MMKQVWVQSTVPESQAFKIEVECTADYDDLKKSVARCKNLPYGHDLLKVRLNRESVEVLNVRSKIDFNVATYFFEEFSGKQAKEAIVTHLLC